jgi:hypothetical protein
MILHKVEAPRLWLLIPFVFFFLCTPSYPMDKICIHDTHGRIYIVLTTMNNEAASRFRG